jgi:RNA polymerase sigma-70 factor (ECF subfamily)
MTAAVANESTDLLPTHRSLLTRLKRADDQEGWQEFFDTYWRLIYGVARKAGLSDAEAQDAVQETVITVSQQMPKFRYEPERCSFKTWLLLITRQRIARQFGKRQQGRLAASPSRSGERPVAAPRAAADTPRTGTIERIPDPSGDRLAAVWDEEWEKHLLSAARERGKRQVSDAHYQIFDLYVVQGWSAGEVARTLGVNVGQVYLVKHRISGLLKREIKQLTETFR